MDYVVHPYVLMQEREHTIIVWPYSFQWRYKYYPLVIYYDIIFWNLTVYFFVLQENEKKTEGYISIWLTRLTKKFILFYKKRMLIFCLRYVKDNWLKSLLRFGSGWACLSAMESLNMRLKRKFMNLSRFWSQHFYIHLDIVIGSVLMG